MKSNKEIKENKRNNKHFFKKIIQHSRVNDILSAMFRTLTDCV